MSSLATLLKILWALPASLLGVGIGVVGLMTGGGVQRSGRILEFWGGAVAWSLEHLTLLDNGAMAMTLGHTVLGRTRPALDLCRNHELVHVRQYERWGPLFIPAYLACSFVLWRQGKDFYRENPFEREAFDLEDPHADHG